MSQSSRSSRSRYAGRARRPWWLPLVLLAGAWIWREFFTPQKENAPAPRSTSRTERSPTTDNARRTSQSKPSKPRSTTNAARVEGGQLFDDVVIKVSDGDTVKLERTGSVRLIGVDTPELHYKGRAQDGGEEAGDFARRALLGKTVQVELCAKQPYDRYGRGLAFIYVSGRKGQRVLFNRELVRQGYARVYSLRPCTVDEDEWNALYQEAKRARRGLFARMDDIPDAAAFRRSR